MLYSDFIERFEHVYWAKTLAVLFEYTEPAGSIGRIGWFVNACAYFGFDNFAYLFVNARQNRNVFLDPGCVWNDREIDRRKEVGVEFSSFCIGPCETFVLFTHEIVHKKALLQEQEIIGGGYLHVAQVRTDNVTIYML